jgi:hypothetical protein
VAAGVGIVTLVLLTVPASDPNQMGLAGKSVSLTYPVIDIALIIGLVRLALRNTRQRTAILLLIAGLALRLTADAGYAVLNFGTAYQAGNVADAFWLLSYACFGAALLHPSVGWSKLDPSSGWTPVPISALYAHPADIAEGALDGDTQQRPRVTSLVQPDSLRMGSILRWAGWILLALSGVTLFLALSWRAPEIMLVSGAYGGSALLILIASAMAP